jgi:hypothetical protein
MDLHKFKDDLSKKSSDGTGPPSRISASALDGNFKKVSPIAMDGEGRAYTIETTDEGWKLLPQVEFDICENGQPRKWWMVATRVED